MVAMARQRFLVIWLTFAFLYLALAALGPDGLLGRGLWPQVNQHLLQVRAWCGDDIVAPTEDGHEERVIQVRPRLDVTPYFRSWVLDDPRERVLLTNLACGVEGSGADRPLEPIRYVTGDSLLGQLQLERMVCHVGSPLGPAFLLLPVFLVLGSAVATQWVGALLGGLGVALIDLLLLWWLETTEGAGSVSRSERLWLVVLAGLGTLWIWLVPQGQVWMFAQTTATCMLALALVCATRRRWLWAGLAFGVAITSRVPTLMAAPILLYLVLSDSGRGRGLSGWRRSWRALALASLFPVLLGTAQLTLNRARFSNPFEVGYTFMLTPPDLRQRLETDGAFSLAHIGRNVRYLLLQPPVPAVDPESGTPRFPYLVSAPEGMGVFFVTPAFLAVFLGLRRPRRAAGLLAATWMSLVLTTAPALLYFNTGWVQWGGRYLLDAWPLWLMLGALGLRRVHPSAMRFLVILSLLSNLWATLLATGGWWP